MQNQNKEPIVYGGFFVRMAAFFVDSLIVAICLCVLKVPMWIVKLQYPDMYLVKQVLFTFSIWDIFMYVLTTAYFVLLTYFTGSTLGKRLFHLKVVAQDGEKLTLINVIYREVIGRYLSSVIAFVGYIMIGVDREKRALHDMLCDTRVIYTCKIKIQYVYPQYVPSPMYPPYQGNQSMPQNPNVPNNQSMPQNPNVPNNQEEKSDTFTNE